MSQEGGKEEDPARGIGFHHIDSRVSSRQSSSRQSSSRGIGFYHIDNRVSE